MNDGILILGFKTDYDLRGKATDWVSYTSRTAISETGNAMHATWERVNVLRPDEEMLAGAGGLEGAAMRSIWAQIEPAYTAWRAGEAMPESGMPLAAWPGVTASQVEALKRVGIKTVEDVANVSEATIARPPLPNLRDLRELARSYINGRAGAELAARINDLEKQNAAMLEMLTEAKSVSAGAEAAEDSGDGALDSADEEPVRARGPGRPRKAA